MWASWTLVQEDTTKILTYKPRVSLIIKGKPNGTNRKEKLPRAQLIVIMEN
jgi:hypothetical protein